MPGALLTDLYELNMAASYLRRRMIAPATFSLFVRNLPANQGRMVFAGEPILEVTAPIAEAQLVETYLLNQVSVHTTLATKAARCRIAAADRIELVDFAFRCTRGHRGGTGRCPPVELGRLRGDEQCQGSPPVRPAPGRNHGALLAVSPRLRQLTTGVQAAARRSAGTVDRSFVAE